MVSSLSQRSENTHHVSLIENYPANLEALGESIRQVQSLISNVTHQRTGQLLFDKVLSYCLFHFLVVKFNDLFVVKFWIFLCSIGAFHCLGRSSWSSIIFQRSPPPCFPLQKPCGHLQAEERHKYGHTNICVQEYDEGQSLSNAF